jgi:hypothetical protein
MWRRDQRASALRLATGLSETPGVLLDSVNIHLSGAGAAVQSGPDKTGLTAETVP